MKEDSMNTISTLDIRTIRAASKLPSWIVNVCARWTPTGGYMLELRYLNSGADDTIVTLPCQGRQETYRTDGRTVHTGLWSGSASNRPLIGLANVLKAGDILSTVWTLGDGSPAMGNMLQDTCTLQIHRPTGDGSPRLIAELSFDTRISCGVGHSYGMRSWY
jgi:hypothetical protein